MAVPEIEPLVARARSRLDRGATLGVPAHVTVLYPFLPAGSIDDAVRREVAAVLGAVEPFAAAFRSIGWFGDEVVFVRPEPEEEFRRLTSLVVARWPEWPPYEGAVGDPIPHLTIGDSGDAAALGAAAAEVAAGLPVESRVTAVELWAGTLEPGSWRRLETFPLG